MVTSLNTHPNQLFLNWMRSEYSPDREAQSWFTFSNKADYNGPQALHYYEARLLTNQCMF